MLPCPVCWFFGVWAILAHLGAILPPASAIIAPIMRKCTKTLRKNTIHSPKDAKMYENPWEKHHLRWEREARTNQELAKAGSRRPGIAQDHLAGRRRNFPNQTPSQDGLGITRPGPILGHLGAILGPSWGHLGAILGPRWPKTPPRQLCRPILIDF